MQIATTANDQPWICTVYYVVDDELNLYWLSLPTRRHSQELAAHNKAAVTVAVKFDQPIIGVQAEGTVSVVNEPEIIASVMKSYTERYDRGQDFYSNFIAGKNEHSLYQFSPKLLQLIDEVNYPGQLPQKLHL